MTLLKSGGQENPIEVYSSEEDPEEDSEEELENYLEEHPSEDVELTDKENQVQKKDSMIEDSPEPVELKYDEMKVESIP